MELPVARNSFNILLIILSCLSVCKVYSSWFISTLHTTPESQDCWHSSWVLFFGPCSWFSSVYVHFPLVGVTSFWNEYMSLSNILFWNEYMSLLNTLFILKLVYEFIEYIILKWAYEYIEYIILKWPLEYVRIHYSEMRIWVYRIHYSEISIGVYWMHQI